MDVSQPPHHHRLTLAPISQVLPLCPTMSSLDDKKYELGIEVNHLESTPAAAAADHHHVTPAAPTLRYPDVLAAMPSAPTVELLERGLDLVRADQARSLGATLRCHWRQCVMTLPYLAACVGQGYDGGAAGITASMPAFLIKFGEFNVATQGLIIPSLWLSLWSSFFNLGIAVGSLAAGPLLDRLGPRRTTFAASLFMLIPIAIQATTQSRGQLLAGKFIGGIPQGIFVVACANFIGEAAGTRLRGPLSSMLALVLIAGIVLGLTAGYQVFGIVTSSWGSWRLVFACQWIAPVITLVSLPFVADSPIFYVKKRRPEQALRQLGKLYGTSSPELEARLATLQHAVALEDEQHARIGRVTYRELVATRSDRRRTLITIGLWVLFGFGGQSFTAQGLYFLVTRTTLPITTIFPIVIACLSLGALVNFASGYLLEKVGRRGLLVYGGGFYALCLAILGGLDWTKSSQGKLAFALFLNLVPAVQQVSRTQHRLAEHCVLISCWLV